MENRVEKNNSILYGDLSVPYVPRYHNFRYFSFHFLSCQRVAVLRAVTFFPFTCSFSSYSRIQIEHQSGICMLSLVSWARHLLFYSVTHSFSLFHFFSLFHVSIYIPPRSELCVWLLLGSVEKRALCTWAPTIYMSIYTISTHTVITFGALMGLIGLSVS